MFKYTLQHNILLKKIKLYVKFNKNKNFTLISGTIYKSCGSGCEETCDNYEQYRNNPNECGLEVTEGCYCPDGQVRLIEPIFHTIKKHAIIP
jgi:hypothetical protein